MERLTSKTDGYLQSVEINYLPTEHGKVFEMWNKLGAYEDAEEQGLLLRLPCKVGDTVYYIDDYEIYWDKANSIDIRLEDDEYIFCIGFMDYRIEDFGKTVFLTKEEAEQALQALKEGAV